MKVGNGASVSRSRGLVEVELSEDERFDLGDLEPDDRPPDPREREAAVIKAGGFGLILKYQLYPWSHEELARRVAAELGLPVDAPRALNEGTMNRFMAWHRKNL